MKKNLTLHNDVFLISCFYYFSYIGTMCLFVFDYYHDFLEYKTMTLETRLFLMNYNNFHYEMGIFLSFYAVSSIFLILYLEPNFFMKNFKTKEKIKEKIKEGKREFNHYVRV